MAVQTIVEVFAVSTLLCLATAIWLSLHLTAVAALFHGKADVVASPKTPRASRNLVILMLVGFGVSLLGVIATQVVAMGAWA